MRAWEVIVSFQRKYASPFEILPFQTERVKSALEGLIVIDIFLLQSVAVVVAKVPRQGAGPIPFGKLIGPLEVARDLALLARSDAWTPV